MAEVQESGPLVGQPFDDGDWRDIFGGEAAIVGDSDGTAFKLTLPSASDVVEVGSPTVRSIAVVGGFRLAIPAGSTQSITIPPSTNAAVGRTDIIAARLDPGTYTSAPGPVRLYRIPGTEGSTLLPSVDEGPPGIELLPLWAITRKQGQSLNTAVVQDLRSWSGPNINVATGRSLPTDVPLGTTAVRGGLCYLRTLSGASPAWARLSIEATDIAGVSSIGETPAAGRLLRYSPAGFIGVQTPTLDVHAANKAYVDTASGAILGVYSLGWKALATSGYLGTGTQVWNASSAFAIAETSIPNPGVPYRVAFMAGAFVGCERDDQLSRFDLDARVGSTTLDTYIPQGGEYHNSFYKRWEGPASIQTFSGAQTFSIVARRVTGSASYGGIQTGSRQGRVVVIAA